MGVLPSLFPSAFIHNLRTLREVVEGLAPLPVLVRLHVPVVAAAVVRHRVVSVRRQVDPVEERRLRLFGGWVVVVVSHACVVLC